MIFAIRHSGFRHSRHADQDREATRAV